jgi:hypothetical protein
MNLVGVCLLRPVGGSGMLLCVAEGCVVSLYVATCVNSIRMDQYL